MTFADTFSFFLTVTAVAIAPGPVVLMLIVRSASNDVKGALMFGIGYAIGGLTITTLMCFGVATWLSDNPEVFTYSKYVMMAYICWLARDIWKGAFDMNAECTTRSPGSLSAVSAGLMTCFLSPYMTMLFPLILPEVMDISAIQMPDFLIIALTTFAALYTGVCTIVIFAAQLRRLARSERAMLVMNRSLASLLVVGGSWMALA